MLFHHVCVESLHSLLPEKAISSTEIETYLASLYHTLKLPKGTLEWLTGIRERRLWPAQTSLSELATAAASGALERASCDPQSVDLLLYTGVCREFIEPATAHAVHHKLGLSPRCMAFDLSNACVGFLHGMLLASQLIESGQVRKALIVSAENATPVLEQTIQALRLRQEEAFFRQSLASLTLGSGAAALLLTHRSHTQSPHEVRVACSRIASEHYELCVGRGDHQQASMQTDSQQLMKEGIALAVDTWGDFLKESTVKESDFQHVFTHQVSVAHQEKVFQALRLPLERGRAECVRWGNTGTAAIPLSLSLAEREGVLKRGDHLALLGIGSGLNVMMMEVQW